MTTYAKALATADCFQRDLLQRLDRYTKSIDAIENGHYEKAQEMITLATHRSPILPYIDVAGGRALEGALSVSRANSSSNLDEKVEQFIEKCEADVEDYEKGQRLLGRAKACYKFFTHQGRKAQDLFLLATICIDAWCYKKKAVEAEKTGQAFNKNFYAWLKEQTSVTCAGKEEEDTALKHCLDEYGMEDDSGFVGQEANAAPEERVGNLVDKGYVREIMRCEKMEQYVKVRVDILSGKRIRGMEEDLFVIGQGRDL